MFNVKKVEIEWAGKKLKLETGKIARQADSTVIATYGGTTVMANVVAAKEAKPDIDFFPLTVNYQEKFYSVGKIPGGFFKREARPTEKETLICRLIDRPVRPLFHKDFKNETQVTWVSFLKSLWNRGLIGLSINRETKVSFSVGLPSLLKKPPGIFPTE